MGGLDAKLGVYSSFINFFSDVLVLKFEEREKRKRDEKIKPSSLYLVYIWCNVVLSTSKENCFLWLRNFPGSSL